MKKYRVQLNLFFLLAIVYTDTGASAGENMKIYTYKPALFSEISFMTAEQKVYELLSAKPIEKNINYLAIPWGVLFRRKNLEVTLPIRLNDGFTICQHIRYREIIPVLRTLRVNVLFAPHAPKEQEYKNIIILSFPLYPTNGINPAQKKNILYSFIGLESHPFRRKIFALPRRPDTVIKKREKWHFYLRYKGKIILVRWSPKREQERKEYQRVLSCSRFSLCPRGSGPSTIRFWESLQAGAIPVLLADAMVLPTIEEINWDDCIIRVPEKNVFSVDNIIRAISPEKEASMRENCLRAYALSCAGENFVQAIRDYFEKKPSP